MLQSRKRLEISIKEKLDARGMVYWRCYTEGTAQWRTTFKYGDCAWDFSVMFPPEYWTDEMIDIVIDQLRTFIETLQK